MLFLENVRVLDLSRVLAGPIATQTLADMGAEVLKIEPPQGDDTRQWGPPFQGEMAAYFMSCNRNKASLVLDLKQQADQRRLEDLIRVADIVIDNYPPPVRQRLGLDPARLHLLNPAIVAVNITGYRGSRSDEPGYDIMIQAESGLMGITGPEEGPGYKVGVAVVDVLTGLMAANGMLAGLYRAARTGQGADLSISLFQTALLSLVNVATNHLVSGRRSRRWGNAHANIVPYQHFQLADRAIIIGCGNDAQFRRLCALLAIDDPELMASDNAWRIEHRERVVPLLAELLATRQSDEVLAALKAERIPCAPILNPAEALSQVRRWDGEALLALRHDQLGELELIANPLRGEGMRQSHTSPPLLDEGGAALAERWLAAPRTAG